jgi:hypothetical protein
MLGLLATTGLAAFALTSCGGNSSANASATAATQRACTNVTNVLANGPDPDADSVGYAEAQVLPLSQLSISNASLHKAIDQLDTAYREFSSNDGADSATYAVKVSAAEKALNKICPNAAP